jgi:hypothetical protein
MSFDRADLVSAQRELTNAIAEESEIKTNLSDARNLEIRLNGDTYTLNNEFQTIESKTFIEKCDKVKRLVTSPIHQH